MLIHPDLSSFITWRCNQLYSQTGFHVWKSVVYKVVPTSYEWVYNPYEAVVYNPYELLGYHHHKASLLEWQTNSAKKNGALHCKKHSMTSLHHGSSCLVYPLVNVDITNWKENHHFLAGQINDFYGPFSMSQTVTVITRGYRWPPVL